MDKPLLTAKTIFDRACPLATAEERQAYLDRACENNAVLRQRVETLLRAYDEADSLPAQSTATDDAVPVPRLDAGNLPVTALEAVGSRIGSYKLLQQIGEGGMGVVFKAEQQEPVRRMVALKVIKAGMDSAQVIARFEAERQALALMDHPNIAKVLDAGTTKSDRPYFVMELVEGVPATKYCDALQLTLRQRLELFVPVCQAIQHAHQKGIIHRDIKPSNVLIAAYDGKAVPKVIDFGVAKAMGQKLTERTLFTGLGGLVGTLEYMSPEQAQLNAVDIDTRSDVYSLGVMLYELLTGSTPLGRRRVKDAAILEVLHLIREEEPPRPSTRLLESKDSLASVSAQRQMKPASLLKAMRGELDWIVMKALEKDRTRRYETANALARDIERYLAEEPVEASPPSATYRLRKLAWKYRRGLATAATLLLLLVAGAVVSAVLAGWAMQERNRATAAEGTANEQRDKAVEAEKAAKQSEEDAKAVLDYFRTKVLSAGRLKNEDGGLGRDVKLRDAVDKAAEKISDSFKDHPLVEASIRDTLGSTYRNLADYPQSIRQHERALALREAKLGADHPDTLQSRNNLGRVYQDAGRFVEAIRLHEQTLKQREATLGADHPQTFITRENLASAYWSAGRSDEAIRLHEENLKQREIKLGADHLDTLQSRNNLAAAYHTAGRTAEAIPLFQQVLKQREAKLGADHSATLTSRNNLAVAYSVAGRVAEAVPLYEQTLKQREAKLGTDHHQTIVSRDNLASAYWTAGRTAEAIPLYEQTLKQSEAKLGADHPDTIITRSNLANAYRSAGRTAEALDLYERNLKLSEAKFGNDHSQTLGNRNLLAEAYQSAGRTADAMQLLEQGLKLAKPRLGPAHPQVAAALAELGRCLLHNKKYDGAEPLLRDSLKIRTAKQPGYWRTFESQSLLGAALLGQKKYAEAEPLLLEGFQGIKKRENRITPLGNIRLREAGERLVKLYDATGKKDEADKWRKELETLRGS